MNSSIQAINCEKNMFCEVFNHKPVFTEPSVYKMAQLEDEMISVDEMSQTEEVSSKIVITAESGKPVIVPETIYRYDTFCKFVELPCLSGVSKGIWRQVSYTTYRQVMEESEKESPAEELEQLAEAEENSDE